MFKDTNFGLANCSNSAKPDVIENTNVTIPIRTSAGLLGLFFIQHYFKQEAK